MSDTHDGTVAVVTGAARGIGRAIAEGLASVGRPSLRSDPRMSGGGLRGTAWPAPERQARRSTSQAPMVGTVGPSPMCPPGKMRADFGSPCSSAR